MKLFTRPVLLAAVATAALACGGDDDTPTPAEDTGTDVSTADTTDAAVADTDIAPTCDSATAVGLGACVQQSRYVADLEFIAQPRAPGTQGAQDVRDHIVASLEDMGLTAELDASIGQGTNVFATLEGTGDGDEIVVISAHYDSVPGCAGADDNATGVAGVLETARVLSQTTHERTILFAFWDEEERGKVGSWHWANAAAAAGTEVVIHLVYEMIGYTSDEANSQALPAGFDLLFPEAGQQVADNDDRGDFIALIANDGAAAYVDVFETQSEGMDLPTVGVLLSGELATASATADLRRSDHEGSWAFGYPAIMITDTADFRNPFYHCSAGEDSVDDLDHAFAARTVAATVTTAAIAASAQAPTNGVAPTGLRDCDPVTNSGCASGEKCATVNEPGGWFGLACVPLVAEPVGTNELCDRPDGISGVDTCDVGNFCAYWGLPYSVSTQRQCLRSCAATSDCAANQACMTFSMTIPSNGVCVDTCDPFAEDACGEDLHCIAERLDVDGRVPWSCHRIRTSQRDETCRVGFDDCAEGLMCGYDADGFARCGEPCDDAHTCPESRTCNTMSNASLETPTAGVCH